MTQAFPTAPDAAEAGPRMTRKEVRLGILAGLAGWAGAAIYFRGQVEDWGPWPAAILAGLLVGAALGWTIANGLAAKRRRRSVWDAEALRQGWVHSADDTGPTLELVKSMLPLRRWQGVSLPHVLYGSRDGVPFFVAHAQARRGKESVDFALAGIDMPFSLELTIEAERMGHRIRETLGISDIDFESQEFSDRFWVRGTDRRRAYDVLHPAAIEFLLRRGTQATWHWSGRTLLVGWPGAIQPREASRFLEEAWDFRALLPRHLMSWGRVMEPPDQASGRPAPPAKGPGKPR